MEGVTGCLVMFRSFVVGGPDEGLLSECGGVGRAVENFVAQWRGEVRRL